MQAEQEARTEKYQYNLQQTIALLAQDVGYIKNSVEGMKTHIERIDDNYVGKLEWKQFLVAQEMWQKDFEKTNKSMTDDMHKQNISFAVFQAQVKTWGTVAILFMGLLQFVIGKFYN